MTDYRDINFTKSKDVFKLMQNDYPDHYFEILKNNDTYNFEISDELAGDIETGLGRSASISLEKWQMRLLFNWLKLHLYETDSDLTETEITMTNNSPVDNTPQETPVFQDNDYHELAMRTAAGPDVFHYPQDKDDQFQVDRRFTDDLFDFIYAAYKLDNWKSMLFYNKIKYESSEVMLEKAKTLFKDFFSEGATLANIDNPQLTHGILGIASEAGEIVEDFTVLMKGMNTANYNDARMNMFREMGDIDWFQELVAEAEEYTVTEVRENNINRLRKRFPNKFSEADAVNRADEHPEVTFQKITSSDNSQ